MAQAPESSRVSPDLLTVEQIRELDTHCVSPLTAQLLLEFKTQRKAIATLAQYVQMFSEGDGTAIDVSDLIADLKEILEGVRVQPAPTNVVPLPLNHRVQCPHCSKPFVTGR